MNRWTRGKEGNSLRGGVGWCYTLISAHTQNTQPPPLSAEAVAKLQRMRWRLQSVSLWREGVHADASNALHFLDQSIEPLMNHLSPEAIYIHTYIYIYIYMCVCASSKNALPFPVWKIGSPRLYPYTRSPTGLAQHTTVPLLWFGLTRGYVSL